RGVAKARQRTRRPPEDAAEVRSREVLLPGHDRVAGVAALEYALAPDRGGARGEARDRGGREAGEREEGAPRPGHFSRTTTRRSAPAPAAQTSPGGPYICRMFAPRRSLGKTEKRSVSGSNITTAFALHSLSHTLSWSST